MIQQKTILKIVDNSGAKTARCIKILGGYKKKYAVLGDIVVVSIQELKNKSKKTSKIKKKEIFKALVIRTKSTLKKSNGCQLNFTENSIVLMNKQKEPFSTRIIGPVTKFLKKRKLSKFVSISSGTI